ncbi:MAG: hypothetical protein U9R60_07335, partial [Bacteroidota bacterium]|nr:hypothetical protein [Bacteroidota bacterium]
WGHFKLSNQFPSGIKGLKRCVDQAAEEGIFVGVHTLSNFITTNDPYVTPVPDQRLAKVGYGQLIENVDNKQIEIPVSNPDIFRQIKNNNLKTVVIDEELIIYKNISEKPLFRLQECERGAYGSIISNHSEGTQVALLADHAYNVFLSDASLTKKMAINIAELFNQTGLRQISFDGLEGNRSTGMGNYGEILMASTWYEHLDDNIRQHFIADASRTSHYFWHIYSRMNWGEPWYAGFRESQTEYRFKNQAYFERNLMPGMLGWFLLTKTTSLEDIEWMLAKSAAYKAGYGFVCNYKTLEENALTDQILALIGRWEEARMKDIFDEQTRMILKDPKLEFHLEKTEDQQWILDQYAVEHYEYLTNQRQPGESEWSQFEFVNPYEEQRLQFTIAISHLMELKDPVLEINNTNTLEMPVHLKPGYRIHYSGGKHIDIFDLSWHLTERIPIDPSVLLVLTGVNKIKMKGKAIGNIPQHVKIELKTKQRLVYF